MTVHAVSSLPPITPAEHIRHALTDLYRIELKPADQETRIAVADAKRQLGFALRLLEGRPLGVASVLATWRNSHDGGTG